MPGFVAENVRKIISDGKIAVLGISYKGNTDDDRESPAYEIIALLDNDYEIAVHDPHIDKENLVGFDEAIDGADLILVLCDHDEFKKMDYDLIMDKASKPIIFDTKNVVEDVPEDITLYNFGNLYKLN